MVDLSLVIIMVIMVTGTLVFFLSAAKLSDAEDHEMDRLYQEELTRRYQEGGGVKRDD